MQRGAQGGFLEALRTLTQNAGAVTNDLKNTAVLPRPRPRSPQFVTLGSRGLKTLNKKNTGNKHFVIFAFSAILRNARTSSRKPLCLPARPRRGSPFAQRRPAADGRGLRSHLFPLMMAPKHKVPITETPRSCKGLPRVSGGQRRAPRSHSASATRLPAPRHGATASAHVITRRVSPVQGDAQRARSCEF